jgi:integrase
VPPRRRPTPSYLPHNQSGRARAVWTDTNGIRHQKLLPGPFDSPESRTAFARLQLELESDPLRQCGADQNSITVAEVLAAYLDHAGWYYRDPDGKPTGEVNEIKLAIRPVRGLYAHTPAAGFGPKSLAAVRQQMIDAGWCRTLINRRMDRVKRVFRWAASEELVPVAVYQALRTVPGLQKGRTDARESAPVGPVADEYVDATLPRLNRHVRAMVELQRLTGMRPGEVCRLTLAEVDRTGRVWVYRPSRHKTAHRGKDRVIAIGPRARAVLVEFLAGRVLDPDDPVFSPRREREERFARLRAARRSRVPPSQRNRRKVDPKRVPAAEYHPHAYSNAIRKACEKVGVPVWSPNQLRHSFATRVRKEHGLEAAQVLLGHARADVTQVYAERNEELAAAVAARIG